MWNERKQVINIEQEENINKSTCYRARNGTFIDTMPIVIVISVKTLMLQLSKKKKTQHLTLKFKEE